MEALVAAHPCRYIFRPRGRGPSVPAVSLRLSARRTRRCPPVGRVRAGTCPSSVRRVSTVPRSPAADAGRCGWTR